MCLSSPNCEVEHSYNKFSITYPGAIPADRVFTYTLPCGQAHPGICATLDETYMCSIHETANELRRLLSRKEGCAFCIWATGRDGVVLHRCHFVVAYFRGSGPRIAVLTEAKLHRDWILETQLGPCTHFNETIDISLVGNTFKSAGTIDCSIHSCELVEDTTFFSPEGRAFAKFIIPSGSLTIIKFTGVFAGLFCISLVFASHHQFQMSGVTCSFAQQKYFGICVQLLT